MRVLLDTTYARRAPYSGTAIYLTQVARALSEIGGVDVVAASNRRRRGPAGGGLGSVRNLLADTWWTWFELPRRAQREGTAVIHHPMPARAPRAHMAQVVTVLDLAFVRLPEHFDRKFRTYASHTHRAAALAAGAVICISETTAEDVRSVWGVPEERIVVAPLGPGQQLAGSHSDTDVEPRHFLYVGDAEPRKNLGVLLSAYSSYRAKVPSPLELVLAGKADANGPGVRAERSPSRERLGALYRDAAALVHPSLYEGFGLTPLEAMSIGTPVLAARSPGVTEVCADAAMYADPFDHQSFTAAMVQIDGDPALRRDLARRGRTRAAEFSWAECARRHAYAYSLALGK
jgi:glycosyltransferase involved in cell wall biosynthesis